MKLALCMIAKDREREIVKALNSTEGVFDVYCLQDTGSKDKTPEVFKNWCKEHKKECQVSRKYLGKPYKFVVVNGEKVLGDFASARNDSFNLARKAGAGYAFWIDSDDVLVNPQGILPLAEKMKRDNIHLAIMTYVYAKAQGNIKPVVQQRERLIDLGIEGYWINRVHEVYSTKQRARMIEVRDIWPEHEREVKTVLDTGRRNHLIMKAQEEEEGIKSFSDAMLNNYAYDHWEHREYEESIKYYKILLKRNLQPSEFLFQIYIKLARAYLQLGNNNKAIEYANESLKLTKSFGEPYVILAEAYNNMANYDDAIYFADKVLQIGIPRTSAPINEIEYLVIPRRIKINCYLQKGDLETALKIVQELMQYDEGIRQEKSVLEKDLLRRNTILGLNNIVRYLQANNKIKYANRLREAIPFDLLDDKVVRNIISEMLNDYNRKTREIKLKGAKSIIFYAGQGVIEPWDGETDVTKGIGGSEGMCIQLSRELAKLGNKVIVYNDCGNSSGKVFGGVMYEYFDRWDSEMKSDIFVSLRRPDVFQRLIRAKKQYLWLHDTTYGDLPTSLFYAPNKVIVLSEAHKQVIKQNHGIDDDDIFWVSRNALNPIAIKYAEENAGERNPYQIIYASSYDRGLDNVLEAWPKIKQAVPQAELKIFYGWDTYDKLMNARKSEEMMRFKTQMVEAIARSEGVQELGKISQNELYKEFAQSGVWAYFSEFYEISCFPRGTRILTQRGDVNIEDLLIDDKVFTHTNELQRIKNLQRKYSQERKYKIEVQCGDDIICTPEHPFYITQESKKSWKNFGQSIKGDKVWKEAKDLKENDILVRSVPQIHKGSIYDVLSIPKQRINNLPTKESWKDNVFHYSDPKVARWLGYFLGDGSANVRTGKVSILIANRHKDKYYQVYKEIMANFDVEIKERELRGCIELFFYSHRFAKFMKKEFYDKSGRKKIEWNIINSRNYKNIYQGLMESDGFDNGYNKSFTNTSLSLIGTMRSILANMGISAKTNKRMHSFGGESYFLIWTESKLKHYGFDGKYLYTRVKKVSHSLRSCSVYNLEVEDDNSYVANGYIVHNCINAMSSQALGCIPVCTPYAALNETVSTKYGMKIQLDKIADALIYILRNPKEFESRRKPMTEWARKQFNMAELGKQWDKEFNG